MRFPNLILIRNNEVYLGYANGRDIGINLERQKKYYYFFLLQTFIHELTHFIFWYPVSLRNKITFILHNKLPFPFL